MVIEYLLDWLSKAPVAKRVESAAALVRAYLNQEIEHDEREDVEAAITILLEDPSPSVRVAIASGFGARASAPRHVISTLAADVVEVSVIVLSRSSVFHDGELVGFIKTNEMDKQIAIACRPWLSSQVLNAICEHACEEACMAVLANPVAGFTFENLHSIADRFGSDVEMRELLLERPDLAAETRLLLITKLSASLSAFVTGNSWLSSARAEQATAEACDRAAINFAATVSDDDVERIVCSLIADDRITVSFLLRAVCMGNITLVARAFSELSGVRFARVEAILTKDRQAAFRAVYDRAGLPKAAFRIFACAISTWRRLLSSGSKINQERMPFLVTREVLEMYSDGSNETIDELMVLLRKLSAEAARDTAKSKAVEISQRAPEVVEQLAYMVAAGEELENRQLLREIEFTLDAPEGDQLLLDNLRADEEPKPLELVQMDDDANLHMYKSIDFYPLDTDDGALYGASDGLFHIGNSKAA